ncbi:uncharacterized protein LOC133818906 [Humulus lupulus]|uniref:uncharacterized protein LOC133818906 n=1 Tax=Humulus lupulus TaxID=3486 RepID=UPI002B404905|nr:uncharacterized protein LOC133818906 [Humulus lupulus]
MSTPKRTTTTTTKLPSPTESPSKPSTSGKFRRLFTESDETRLLKSFLKLSKHSSPSSAITSPNLERIRTRLGHKFSHSQIIDKLRRLRIKYHREARTKSLIKTPHDKKLHKIARKIWGKKPQSPKREDHAEEEKIEMEMGCGGLLENEELSKGKWWECLDEEKVRELQKRWVRLRMEEAEVMIEKAELIKEHMKLISQALGFSSSSSSPTSTP